MYITANGINIHYMIEGPDSAPVLTLSHSLATDLSMWDMQIEALTSNFRVLRYDTRGHGGTDAPAGAYTLEMLAEDVRALLHSLDIQRTHFLGLSMGGMIGQMLALQTPEILKSLILCDTSSRVPPEARSAWDERIHIAETEGIEPLVQPTIQRWFTEPFRQQHPEVVEPVLNMIRSTRVAGYIGCCHAIAPLDLTDRLNIIVLPTLIIVGEDDPGTPVAVSQLIHEKIRGSRLVILKSAAHLSNLEQPEKFNEAVTGFLAGH